MDLLWTGLFVCQLPFAIRVVLRLIRTARRETIGPGPPAPSGSISIVIPVLDEARRIGACLEALAVAPNGIAEILVVDGGSTDETGVAVARASARDPRVRWIDAGPAAAGWNGKAWNLQVGLSACTTPWVLMLDADVLTTPGAVDALAAHAKRLSIDAFSVAARQRLAGAGDALVHPAMLTTLVYRFGIPGQLARRVAAVQANGQCFFARRDLLMRTGAIESARGSRSEDVTMARAIVAAGTPVGFYEAGDLVTTAMYADWRETLRNWPRSLPMIDRFARTAAVLGLAEIVFVQALPPLLAIILAWAASNDAAAQVLLKLQIALLFVRTGTLGGMRRAYRTLPWTYWLSPLCDLPVVLAIIISALRRRQRWRGRLLVE